MLEPVSYTHLDVYKRQWWDRAVDIIPQKGGKGSAIHQILAHYKISKEEAIAFGDGENDIDMLLSVGTVSYTHLLREHYNDKLMKAEYDVELAALFVFINKHCFNGLYRVNGKGLFNVPYNNSRRTSVDEEAIMATSKYLQGVTIIAVSYTHLLNTF